MENQVFRKYFEKVWMKTFPPQTWCSSFWPDSLLQFNTNNYIERNFRELKESIEGPNHIDRVISALYDYAITIDKDVIRRRSIPHPRTVNRPLDDIVYRMKKQSLNYFSIILIYY